ncbi:Embryonic polyadenylate-binding protein 2 [Cricetulus griseus]|uniref:Embryonic polyadenylate-binding protein 2 n=1 Tax=Cricetulus griseus TaxID=10029 RepID=G3GRS6_CRIGR|nr:Embryonic polyadenylate-binding protein 2 [Cricetulus griseus]ERE79471.1 embryonic polyadenylate-binding protein 2-like isoform 1 [Cricetulus griseus]
MWPFLNNDLFPPPTEAWLQKVSSDPEAQGWGAWGKTEKTPLGPGTGSGTESDEEVEENEKDAGFLLSLLEQENLAKSPGYNQELEAIKLKLWAMEHAETLPEQPYVQRKATEEKGAEVGQLLSPEIMGCFFPGTPKEKVEADHRSVYVGNVDYGGSAAELRAYFSPCGEIHRVTILCDKFSGHPKGYAYIEFASQNSVQAAVELDESTFRGRVIKGPWTVLTMVFTILKDVPVFKVAPGAGSGVNSSLPTYSKLVFKSGNPQGAFKRPRPPGHNRKAQGKEMQRVGMEGRAQEKLGLAYSSTFKEK